MPPFKYFFLQMLVLALLLQMLELFTTKSIPYGKLLMFKFYLNNFFKYFRIALGFIFVNLLFGVGSVVICYIFAGELETSTRNPGDVIELHLIALMYTIAVKSEAKDEAKIWAIIAYAAILLAGFISMVNIFFIITKK